MKMFNLKISKNRIEKIYYKDKREKNADKK